MLQYGRAGDAHEREADAIADQALGRTSSGARVGAPFPAVPPEHAGAAVTDGLNSPAGSLDDSTRRFMELHKAYLPGWEGEAEVRQLAGPGEKLCDSAHAEEEAVV